jgi:NADH:ubiquinone oxidoreductase subunit 3 (subunit A)
MDVGYIVIIITLIICLFLVWFFSHKARHQEKLLRIEMGLSDNPVDKRKMNSSNLWTKLAFLVIGQGIAFLIIALLVYLKWLDNGGNALPIAIMAVMGGLSMLMANYVLTKKHKD